MLAPFVFPEALVIALVILPVGIHVAEKVCLSSSRENGRDVGVCSVGITIGVVGAIAVIRPETMDGPRICGSGRWTIVPELGLERQNEHLRLEPLVQGSIIPAKAVHQEH